MKRRIVFRADASKNTGYGHFIRSLALVGYLKNDFDCYFASFNADTILLTDNQLKQICEVCEPLLAVGSTLEAFNIDFLSEIQSSDIVVLDNYYFSTEYQQKIKDKGCKLVCIDDLHDRHMVCDLLITPSPLKRKDFSLEPYTKFIGGIEYGFLRPPFFKAIPERNILSGIERVVLAMGGSDAFNVTDKIAAVVHKVLPESKLDIIAGDSVSISDDTNSFATIHRSISANDIAAIMDDSDIGIFPASTICIEAFSRRLPVIVGYYVDNQKDFYNYGVRHHYFADLGNLLDDSSMLFSRLEEIIGDKLPSPNRIDFDFRREEIKKQFLELSKI